MVSVATAVIWQARERAAAMVTSDSISVEAAWSQTSLLGAFVNLFAFKRARVSPLWYGGVSTRMWESTSSAGSYSSVRHPHGPWIADGARYGFSLLSDGSVRRQAEATEWMAKQVRSGKTAPVSDEEARDLIGLFTSPVVGAPKPGAPEGTIRTCHHLSSGGELSINEGIDFDPLSPIGLLLVDSVVSCVRYMRRMEPTRKIRIAKFDMEGFFRQIPLRRRDMARVTQRWNGVMNVHTAFTFGARSAPHVCSVVTNALCDEMARLGHFCQYYFVNTVSLSPSKRTSSGQWMSCDD